MCVRASRQGGYYGKTALDLAQEHDHGRGAHCAPAGCSAVPMWVTQPPLRMSAGQLVWQRDGLLSHTSSAVGALSTVPARGMQATREAVATPHARVQPTTSSHGGLNLRGHKRDVKSLQREEEEEEGSQEDGIAPTDFAAAVRSGSEAISMTRI